MVLRSTRPGGTYETLDRLAHGAGPHRRPHNIARSKFDREVTKLS